jgi:hypothetical protein
MSYTYLTPGMDAMTIWKELSSWGQRQAGNARVTAENQAVKPITDCEDDCHFCQGPETD